MKKTLIPLSLLLALSLTACGGNNNPTTTTTTPSPTTTTGTITPATSTTTVAPLPTTTTTTTTTAQGNVISEYSATSKVYFENTPTSDVVLKTYHAAGKGDVPYVDIEAFMGSVGYAFSTADPSVSGKVLTYSVPNKTDYIKFNAKDNKLEFNNINNLASLGKTNNGIGPDLALDATIYIRESDKTKIAKTGSLKTIDLTPYGINIYEQNGKFYAPFELLTNTLLSGFTPAYIYNGKDFFQDNSKFDSPEYTSLCYSGEKGFLYFSKHSNGQNEYNTTFYKVTPKSGESYRFQTISSSNFYSAVVLYPGGTGKLVTFDTTTNQEVDAKVEYNFGDGKRLFKYRVENNLLSIDAYDVDLGVTEVTEASVLKHSLKVNLDKTRYGEATRSQEIADYNYGLLCLTFDNFYGIKEDKGITSFDQFFTSKNLKNDIKSLNMKTYNEALTKALQKELNDAHTAMHSLSVYGEPCSVDFVGYADTYKSEINNKVLYGTGVLNSKRFDTVGANPLNIVGDTAFISFNQFSSFGLLSAMDSYTDEPRDYAGQSYNGLGIVCSSLNEIAKNPEIKNVVFDITANTGGLLNVVPFIAGIATADPTMYIKDTVSGQVTEYHYNIRLNGDPTPTTLSDKYNFYVMTSQYSFSCATALPTMLKGTNVKIIGQKGAGGTSPVFRLNDACGSVFNVSGIFNIVYKSGNEYLSNEAGIPVDIEIAEADFYNFEKVATTIKNNK